MMVNTTMLKLRESIRASSVKLCVWASTSKNIKKEDKMKLGTFCLEECCKIMISMHVLPMIAILKQGATYPHVILNYKYRTSPFSHKNSSFFLAIGELVTEEATRLKMIK